MRQRKTITKIILTALILLCLYPAFVLAQTSDQHIDPTHSFLGDLFSIKSLIDQNPLHQKIWQTVFVFVIGYLLMFLFIGITNRKVIDIKARHILRKNVVYTSYLLNLLYFEGFIA